MAGDKESRSKAEISGWESDPSTRARSLIENTIWCGQAKRIVDLEERMSKEMKEQTEVLTAKMAEMISMAMSKVKGGVA